MTREVRRPRKAPTTPSVEAPSTHPDKQQERALWLAANAEAIAAYNRRIATHGIFSDDWRRF